MKPLIAGNWKMHGDMQWSAKLSEFKTLYPISERAHIDVLVCPPAPFIAPLVKAAEEAGYQRRYAARRRCEFRYRRAFGTSNGG